MKPLRSITYGIPCSKRKKTPIVSLPSYSWKLAKRTDTVHMTWSKYTFFEEYIRTLSVDTISPTILTKGLTKYFAPRECMILIESKFGKRNSDITNTYSISFRVSDDDASYQLSGILDISDKTTK
jgi:hypothetical protein